MKIKVIKEHEAELLEVADLGEYLKPTHYQSPFVIILKGGRNFMSEFEFLTPVDFLNKNGKRRYFDSNSNNAQQFESFNRAVEVAKRFKAIDSTKLEQFFVVGWLEAKVVQMKINENIHKFKRDLEIDNV